MRRTLVATTALVLASLPAPALALCARPPSIARAVEDTSNVFVGTVTGTSSQGRWATVEVVDVWKGDPSAEVEVRGGPADPPGPMMAASSVDRTYRDGETYLFLPYAGSGEVFHDDICSGTRIYEESLDRLRPPGAHEPPRAGGSPPRRGAEPPGPWWIAAAAVGAAAVVLRWRRRAGDRSA